MPDSEQRADPANNFFIKISQVAEGRATRFSEFSQIRLQFETKQNYESEYEVSIFRAG
jgi:hypothetical protein